MLAHIAVAGELSPAERVAVYATSYLARLHDALAEDFPATDALLGHERFHAAALEYARMHPSTSPDLADFGGGFAASLPAGAARDLAALEWARVEAFRAADAAPLEAARLEAIAPDRWASLRFVAHPSLRLVHAAFRVDAAWRSADAGGALSPPVAESGALRVWREGTTVYHAWMEPAEAAALSALAAGEAFATAAERVASTLAADPETAATTLATLLRDWLADGVFSAVR